MGLPLHTRVLEKPLKILYFGPKDKFNEACHTIGGKIGKKEKKVLRQPNLTVKSFSLERTHCSSTKFFALRNSVAEQSNKNFTS